MTVPAGAPATPRSALERELKFTLPASRAPFASRLLAALCRPDPRFAAAVVSTVYYDSPDLRLLGQKLNSDFLKTKVRLRWYRAIAGDAGSGGAFIEVKSRVGCLRRKARAETELPGARLEAAPLTDPVFARALDVARTLDGDLPAHLLPVMMVRYERHRFVEPISRARVSLDFRIEAPRANRALLGQGGPVRLDVSVVEVKGAGEELPRALRPLAHVGARRTSFSKYGELGVALLRFRP